jgi:pilus assembly protein FimV
MDGDKAPGKASAPAPSMDLSSISLDLGGVSDAAASAGGSDPKWQEVATKLDLAKAYEEMGDKDGARELLGEVMKDGDTAQKGQAQQLLAKLG